MEIWLLVSFLIKNHNYHNQFFKIGNYDWIHAPTSTYLAPSAYIWRNGSLIYDIRYSQCRYFALPVSNKLPFDFNVRCLLITFSPKILIFKVCFLYLSLSNWSLNPLFLNIKFFKLDVLCTATCRSSNLRSVLLWKWSSSLIYLSCLFHFFK